MKVLLSFRKFPLRLKGNTGELSNTDLSEVDLQPSCFSFVSSSPSLVISDLCFGVSALQ